MVLLDTHVLIWMLFDDSRLSKRALETIEKEDCCISVVSIWEMALKMSSNKMKLAKSLSEIVLECDEMGIDIAGITAEDCLNVQNLPWLHKDPFDRMTIAQAITENIPLITHDRNIHRYDAVSCIW